MSVVQIKKVEVLDNPAPFFNPIQLEITYLSTAELKDDVEVKLTYVGSATGEQYDQVLGSILIGPIDVGEYRVLFEAEPPNPELIPADDVIGLTVILLTMSYQNQEFVRVGYYVSTEYEEEELKRQEQLLQQQQQQQSQQRHRQHQGSSAAPRKAKIQFDKLVRHILANKPRVTQRPINWGDVMQSELSDRKLSGSVKGAGDTEDTEVPLLPASDGTTASDVGSSSGTIHRSSRKK